MGYVRRRRLVNAAVIISPLLFLALALPRPAAQAIGPAAPAAEPVKLLLFGDSLTAGRGLAVADGFAARLGRALNARGSARGWRVSIVNGGVSGDTTAGGRARLAWSLADKPDAVIIELGANDALRGLDPRDTRANLDAMLGRLKAAGIPVLLAGMKAPPNLGSGYTGEFDAIFPELAARHGVPLYPFFLAGVAARPDLNQADGIHPNARGVKIIVAGILPAAQRLIEALLAKRRAAGR